MSIKYLFPLLLCMLSCQQNPKQADNSPSSQTTTLDVTQPQKQSIFKKTDIRKIFQEVPSDLLNSSLCQAPDLALRKKIISQQAENKTLYRDIVVDTVAQYLFYDKEKDNNRGVLTTIASFPLGDSSGELVAIEISLWSDTRVETENLHFLKRNPVGGYQTVNTRDILPTVRLEDFYKGDIAEKIVDADHNYLPVLCYEMQRGENKIKVFLGEWFHEKESFKYKPDVDFIELVWKDSHFEKISAF